MPGCGCGTPGRGDSIGRSSPTCRSTCRSFRAAGSGTRLGNNSWLNVTCTAADDRRRRRRRRALAAASARQLHLIDDMFGLAGGSRGSSTFLVNDVLHVVGGRARRRARDDAAAGERDRRARLRRRSCSGSSRARGACVGGKSLAISDADEMFSPHGLVARRRRHCVRRRGTNRAGAQLGEFWTLLEGEVFNTSACWTRSSCASTPRRAPRRSSSSSSGR